MSRLCSRLAGGGGVLLIAAGALLVWGLSPGSAQGTSSGATMSIAPASQNIALGSDAFTVNIEVSDVQDLGAFDATIKFNPNVLEYVSSTASNYLGSSGRVQACIPPLKGPVAATVADNINANGAFHFGCHSDIFVPPAPTPVPVVPGPSGSGRLGSVTFRVKALGSSEIKFVGLEDGKNYVIRQPDPAIAGDAGERGASGLADTLGVGVGVIAQDGIVAVYDPSQPTPTGVPATSTPQVVPTSDVQATVRAVLGTPGRTLPTPGPTLAPGQSASTAGSAGSGDPAGTIRADGSVAGASTGGGSGSSGAGSAGGASGSGLGAGAGARGPNGAPIAGYGPQPREHSRLPLNAGLLMIAIGTLALTAGVLHDRRRA